VVFDGKFLRLIVVVAVVVYLDIFLLNCEENEALVRK